MKIFLMVSILGLLVAGCAVSPDFREHPVGDGRQGNFQG